VQGDICGFRISTVGQGARFVGSLPLSLHLLSPLGTRDAYALKVE
jgi:hypothetical protein